MIGKLKMSSCSLYCHAHCLYLLMAAVTIMFSVPDCNAAMVVVQRDSKSETAAEQDSKSKPDDGRLNCQFESGVRIRAGNEPIEVESPGYACPTLADVDGDGVEDLVVGQFRKGKMKWYRNIAKAGRTPEYEKGKWIETSSVL